MQTRLLPLDPTVLKIGQSSGVRAPGLHASDIYGDYYQDYDPKRYKRREGDAPPPLLLETGLIFESMLEEGLARRLAADGIPDGTIERPGEFTHRDTVQGVPFDLYYNPDLAIFNGVYRIGEIKATYMSSTVSTETIASARAGDESAREKIEAIPFEPKFEKYLSQIMFYGHMQRTPYARLYVWFICGNYKPPTEPHFLAWDLEFTEDEMASEYAMLVNHALAKGLIA